MLSTNGGDRGGRHYLELTQIDSDPLVRERPLPLVERLRSPHDLIEVDDDALVQLS